MNSGNSKFGDLTVPFGRCKIRPLPASKQKVEDWHKNRELFAGYIHNAENNGLPEHPKEVQLIDANLLELIKKRTYDKSIKKKFCYIWVINQEEIIEILWEGLPNLEDTLFGEVKHTNITAGEKAYHGGELFFGEDDTMYINNRSDRYGEADEFWQVVVNHFQEIYKKYKVVDIQTV